MFGLFRGKSNIVSQPPNNIRDTLFGDIPINEFRPQSADVASVEPWSSFVDARDVFAASQVEKAIDVWQRIVAMSGLESRHYLQAWHFLRGQKVNPPAESAGTLLGVVVEVAMNDGLDLLAAYSDRHARYFNFSGGAIIWEHPDNSLDLLIDSLLAAGTKVLQAIGPWEKDRPPAPPHGHLRLNLLSPSGLHFGQGPYEAFAADSLAKPAIDAAIALMQGLIQTGNRG